MTRSSDTPRMRLPARREGRGWSLAGWAAGTLHTPRSAVRSARGQSIVEYAIVIGVVTAAVLGMQLYAKRGLQAGIKIAADQIGSQREGLLELDPQLSWKVRGHAVIRAESVSAVRTEVQRGGRVSERGGLCHAADENGWEPCAEGVVPPGEVQTVAVSRGIGSFNIAPDRN